MGAVGGMLGLSGGAGGTGFTTQAGTDQQQLQNAYQGSQNAMQGQQGLLAALQGQNGLGNQSQVYGQLQNVASGQGPNPAQAMLNQQTGQNVANQAALMAGQRGAGANVGLMARQAAQQVANIQQQAVGQGATMQANQSLNALGQAGNLANTMAANQIGQQNANVTSQQNEQGILQGANTANNSVQGQLANTRMGQQPGIIGGLMNGIGGITGMFADGGPVDPNNGAAFGPQSMFGQATQQPQQTVPTFAPAPAASPSPAKKAQGGSVGDTLKAGGSVPGNASVKGDSYKNDTVHAMVSPDEIVLPRSVTLSKDPVGESAKFVAAILAKKGKMA